MLDFKKRIVSSVDSTHFVCIPISEINSLEGFCFDSNIYWYFKNILYFFYNLILIHM